MTSKTPAGNEHERRAATDATNRAVSGAGTHTVNLPPPPPPRKSARVLRLIGWNTGVLAAGLILTGAAAETWFRLTTPFLATSSPKRFLPKVGLIFQPNAEGRWTNRLDFWTVQRSNSLGFLDREPISPQRAIASCHVAMIGDSFVEAIQIPIADKFHVRLEALAARQLPDLDITTAAFGLGNTGQINQLPFYDEFARRLRPKLLVLVFLPNDFMNNAPADRQMRA